VRIGRETRESLIFVVGVLGLLSQGFVGAIGKPVSIPLCLIYLTICGVIGAPALLAAILPGNPQPPEERRRADVDGEPDE
jgi:hypothetical protein